MSDKQTLQSPILTHYMTLNSQKRLEQENENIIDLIHVFFIRNFLASALRLHEIHVIL